MKRALRPFGFQINFVRGEVTAPSTQTGIEYWRDGLERQMPRWYEITWRGRRIIRVRSAHNERAYWRPRRDLINLIEEMTDKRVLPSLHPGAKVFEPGCNVAQNLWDICERWDCAPYGLDIDQWTIAQATTRRWKRRPRFFVANVLDPGTLSRTPKGHFDLVLTRWHLIHVPASDSKRRYINELRRIGKAGIILEPFSPSKAGQLEWAAHRSYCLSWDDWVSWYGLNHYRPTTAIPYTEVFFW
jgi:hypothetical protein